MYGAAFSIADVAGTVAAAAIERASGSSRMALFYAAFSIGALTALVIGAMAETVDVPPPLHLGFTAGALLVVGTVALRPLSRFAAASSMPAPQTFPTAEQTAPGAVARTAGPKARTITLRVIALGAIGACVAVAESAANNWLPLALIDAHGVPSGIGVLALALVVCGNIVIRLTGDRLVGRLGRVTALRVTLLLGVMGVLLVILSPLPWLTFIGVAL